MRYFEEMGQLNGPVTAGEAENLQRSVIEGALRELSCDRWVEGKDGG